jgi:hypothetical protein
MHRCTSTLPTNSQVELKRDRMTTALPATACAANIRSVSPPPPPPPKEPTPPRPNTPVEAGASETGTTPPGLRVSRPGETPDPPPLGVPAVGAFQ